jgi:ribonuclease HI
MLEIYCDGAYSSSRNIGGWAIVVLENGDKILSDFYPITGGTNNTAEIQAAIEACWWARNNGYYEFTIYTDSMYVIGAISKDNKRNKNVELLETLDRAVEGLKITWTHVKGHKGNKYNELCDALAVQATFVT